jgi:hypothetical protein
MTVGHPTRSVTTRMCRSHSSHPPPAWFWGARYRAARTVDTGRSGRCDRLRACNCCLTANGMSPCYDRSTDAGRRLRMVEGRAGG